MGSSTGLAPKKAITDVSKPVQDNTGNAGTRSAVKNHTEGLREKETTADGSPVKKEGSESEIIKDQKSPFKELQESISTAQAARRATDPAFGPMNKNSNFMQMMDRAIAASNASAAADSLREDAFGGRGQGGPHNPGTYGGDPNTVPGLNGYHFGSLKPIQHARPDDAVVGNELWSMVNNHLSRAFVDSKGINDSIKPYIGMDIGQGFKNDAFSLSVFAMYKPTEEQVKSGKLDFLLEDKRGYSDYTQKFWSLIDQEGIDRSHARDVLKTFGGIVSLSNIDPRFVVQSIKDKDYLEDLKNKSNELRERGGGVDPKFTVALHVVNDPSLDFNGVHNKNHGFRIGQLSALKDSLPQYGKDSASNVIVGVVQGNGAQTRSQHYTNFIGSQMEDAKARYNLILNYDSHGSGYHAAIGQGADGSIDKSDAAYFRQIGYQNAFAESITVNLNSCSNGNLSKVAGEYIAQGVNRRRQEIGMNKPLSDMQIVTRGTTDLGWLSMDGNSNYLTYWDSDGMAKTIHGSLGNDMETHTINIKGNGIERSTDVSQNENDKAEKEQRQITQNDQKQEQAKKLDSEKQLAGDGEAAEGPEKKKKNPETSAEPETQVA